MEKLLTAIERKLLTSKRLAACTLLSKVTLRDSGWRPAPLSLYFIADSRPQVMSAPATNAKSPMTTPIHSTINTVCFYVTAGMLFCNYEREVCSIWRQMKDNGVFSPQVCLQKNSSQTLALKRVSKIDPNTPDWGTIQHQPFPMSAFLFLLFTTVTFRCVSIKMSDRKKNWPTYLHTSHRSTRQRKFPRRTRRPRSAVSCHSSRHEPALSHVSEVCSRWGLTMPALSRSLMLSIAWNREVRTWKESHPFTRDPSAKSCCH